LVKERDVAQRSEQFSRENWLEVDDLFALVLEPDAQYMRADDFE
jgi:hypothetical protein